MSLSLEVNLEKYTDPLMKETVDSKKVLSRETEVIQLKEERRVKEDQILKLCF